MSRSTLIVVALLVAISLLAWYQPWNSASPPPAAPSPAAVPAPPTAPLPGPPPARPAPAPTSTGPAPEAKIAGRADLAAFLAARGIDPDRAIDALRAWRESRGFLGPDDLTGVTASDSRSLYYANLDQATLTSLAAAGDAAAVHTLAGRKQPQDPVGAIAGYGDAAAMGSAAAMQSASELLRGLAQFPADGIGVDPKVAADLLKLRRGDPTRDLRADALAWSLAAVRQYGPGAVDQGTVRWMEVQREQLPPETLALACGQSLAIFADLNARGAPRDALPPVLTSENEVYARLPCQDSAAPIAPPAELARCASTPVRNQFGQTFAVWTCPNS